MKKVIDSQAVNERMNELRRSAKILSEYAAPIYRITTVDADFSQLWRIYSAPNHFAKIREARLVLSECGEKAGKRLTISDEQERNYQKIAVNIRGKLYVKRNPAEWFVVSKGVVQVDEKAQKELEKMCSRTVDDEHTTINGWMSTLVSLINACPEKGLRNRLGRFALSQNESLKGAKVTVQNDQLQVVDIN